ncbi:S-methyl-5'-thioadenosine phosphorylase [archaeon]|nr:S-methyl-5'-thioadenosine phosphorylase [archaeon]
MDVGVLGGSGLYETGVLKDAQKINVYTPYGAPSDLFDVGTLAGKRVAFLARHGRNHSVPPHKVHYRANVWAMRDLGAQQIIGESAVGSLKEEIRPGDFVVPDQFLDFTSGREHTFYDGPEVYHVGVADPYCPRLQKIAIEALEELSFPYHSRKTLVTINGPRFSTRAESSLFRQNADIIGMTGVPECVLARELALCYVNISIVTDYDVWKDEPVSMQKVAQTVKQNNNNIRQLLTEVVPRIGKRECDCSKALENAKA